MKLKYLTSLFLLLVLCTSTFFCIAQDEPPAPTPAEEVVQNSEETSATETSPQKAIPTTNILHQNKRINLVVFVLATIFVGIILYLIRIELKLRKLEKK